MNWVVFFLAQDIETGKIVDDCYVTPVNANISVRTNELCEGWRLKMIDIDGPFWVPFWPTISIHRRPKWANKPPLKVSNETWNKRFKSIDELVAYREGIKLGKLPN